MAILGRDQGGYFVIACSKEAKSDSLAEELYHYSLHAIFQQVFARQEAYQYDRYIHLCLHIYVFMFCKLVSLNIRLFM